MRVLAIDPGPHQSGFAQWDGKRVIDSGVAENSRILELIGCSGYDTLAVEQIGHYGTGMPAGREVFDTCFWIGRFIEKIASSRPKASYRLVLRPTVKTHFCGTARAKDANVRQALIDRLGRKGTKREPGPTFGVSSHAWQALALAVYVTDYERIYAVSKGDTSEESTTLVPPM